MTDIDLLPCGQCGMPCRADEYHPFAACLMFKACHNSETVRANLAPLQAEIEVLRAEVDRLRADRDSWEQQASDRVADWHAEHLRAEKLAEALRELVDVFRESGMYDEELFDKARAALATKPGGAE